MTQQKSIAQRITSNLAALSGGVTLGRACGLLWLPYLTRRLGPSELGTYILVGAIGAVLVVVAQWGSGAASLRLFAPETNDRNRSGLLSAFFQVRMAGAILLCAGVSTIWWLVGNDRLLPWLLLLAAPGMAADMLRTPLNSWQLAQDRPLPSIALDGGLHIATRVAGVAALELGGGLGALIATMATVRVCALPITAYLWWSHETWPSLRGGRKHLRHFLSRSAPFGIVATLLVIDARIDLFMLSLIPGQLGGTWVSPATATGLYAVPLRIIGAVLIPLEPLRAALVPTLVRLVNEDRKRANHLHWWVSRVMTSACAAPAAIALASLAPFALFVVAPESFHGALPTLQVLCIALVFRIAQIPVAAAASVHSRPIHLVAPAAATLISNILLNLAFIPMASHLGAAIATTLSSIIGFAVYRSVATRVVGSSPRRDTTRIPWLLWTSTSGAIAYILHPAPIAFLVAATVYIIGTIRNRRVRRDDIDRLRELVRPPSHT